MRRSQAQSTATLKRDNSRGALMIAIGLTVLLIAVVWPGFPAVTGLALLVMGATIALILRFRCSPVLPAITTAHLLVYSALYLLFVGAVFHAAFAKPGGGVTLLQCADLGLSVIPMVAAMRIALATIADDADVPAR